MKTQHRRNAKRSGITLIASMVILGGIALLAVTAYIVSSTNTGINRNHRDEVKALYQAEAGIQYAKSRITTDLASTFNNLSSARVVTVNYAAPSGFTFDTISNVTILSSGSLLVQAVGRSTNASATIQAVFGSTSGGASMIGVFGYQSVSTANGSDIWSYSSHLDSTPTAAESTHAAGVGSDGSLSIGSGTYIDGSLHVGAIGTVNASVNSQGSTYAANIMAGPIPQDPLGLNNGGVAGTAYSAAITANKNSTIGISSGGILQGNKTLGPGDYYFCWLNLDSDTLTIDNRSNKTVRLFVQGPEDSHVDNGSRIILLDMNNTKGFQVYSKGSKTIHFDNASFVPGFWYSPTSLFTVDNGGVFDGVMWGNKVEIKGNSQVFIDNDAQNISFGNAGLDLKSWKEVRR